METGPPFSPSLAPLCIEWREKDTRPEHTWGMKGMLITRHCYWIAWCSRQGSERAHGWYMSSLLLFYAFDYTLLFLTMDRYPFVDLAFAYYESPLDVDVDVYVVPLSWRGLRLGVPSIST